MSNFVVNAEKIAHLKMKKGIKRINLWFRRKSMLPMIIVGVAIVAILFFNDETSVALNMEYDRQINELKSRITECKDSARYFRSQTEAILHENADLEKIAREKFHMQRPYEDVYIITD